MLPTQSHYSKDAILVDDNDKPECCGCSVSRCRFRKDAALA